MYFIGQTHIMNQLKDILPYLFETGAGMNILIRGPSGWGKTRMAFQICNYLTGGSFDYKLADKFSFNPKYRVHFIDEIHLLTTPEALYPVMDSGKYVIILATNDIALLNEALANRCTQFNFTQYTIPELRSITKLSFRTVVPDSFLDYIIECGGGNPRSIKNIVSRLNIMVSRRPEALSGLDLNSFKALMEDSFGIKDGLDVMCTRYIEALKSIGGTASLQTISTIIHIDQNTLKFYVEPILLYKSMIKITNRGRTIL